MELLDKILKIYYDNQTTMIVDVERRPVWVIFCSIGTWAIYKDEEGHEWRYLVVAIDEDVSLRFSGQLQHTEKLHDLIKAVDADRISVSPVELSNEIIHSFEGDEPFYAGFTVELTQRYAKPLNRYTNDVQGLRPYVR